MCKYYWNREWNTRITQLAFRHFLLGPMADMGKEYAGVSSIIEFIIFEEMKQIFPYGNKRVTEPCPPSSQTSLSPSDWSPIISLSLGSLETQSPQHSFCSQAQDSVSSAGQGQGHGLQWAEFSAPPGSKIRRSGPTCAALSHLTRVCLQSLIRADFDGQQKSSRQQAANTVSPNWVMGGWGSNHHLSRC